MPMMPGMRLPYVHDLFDRALRGVDNAAIWAGSHGGKKAAQARRIMNYPGRRVLGDGFEMYPGAFSTRDLRETARRQSIGSLAARRMGRRRLAVGSGMLGLGAIGRASGSRGLEGRSSGGY